MHEEEEKSPSVLRCVLGVARSAHGHPGSFISSKTTEDRVKVINMHNIDVLCT